MNKFNETQILGKTCAECLVCGRPIRRWRIKNTEGFAWPIDQCASCGFAFVNPRPSFEFLMDFYRQSGHRSHMGPESKTAESLETVLKREEAEPNSSTDAARMLDTLSVLRCGEMHRTNSLRFLDVGCGFGFFSAAAQRRGFQVTAIELAETERAIAAQMLGAEPIASSFEDFSGGAGGYSVVLMSQILEHALDIDSWIEKARNLLERNGHLIVALPNFSSLFRYLMQENEPYISPPAHLNFFNAHSLSTLLELRGFRVVSRQWITRIPVSVLQRRLGNSLGAGLAPLARLAARAIDLSRLGMMINVYAQKV